MVKNYVLSILFLGCFLGNFFQVGKLSAQTTTSVTIVYTGFQACGGCTVCGADYWCFNTLSSYCGNTTACGTKTFTDPVPPGNIITNINVQYYSAQCGGNSLTATINGNAFPTVNEGNAGCPCSNNPCGVSASTTDVFPCGVTGYNYGTTNTLQLCTGADVCINKLVLLITYVPANQATPASQPGAISGTTPVCPGSTHTYSISPVANANNYTWTVPAGWTINSGQGTTSISATAGASGGNVCVTASNLCGSSSSTCFPVTMASNSSAPTGASALPANICPAQSSTLSVSGGSLGSGANWTWYSGSCGGTVVGTGSSIVVSPGSTTTYYVAAVGTCNTTACANVTVNVGGTQATPGTPAGTTSICSGTTQTFTTSGSAGASSYNWTVPAGSVINSGQGTTSISVTFGSTSGNVCVNATGTCGTSASACTPVTITSVPTAPASITGSNPVCPGSQGYSISAVAGSTGYTWSVAGGGSITGGQGTTSSTVNWPSATTGTVSVTANNTCGSSTSATFTVLVNPKPIISIVPTPTAVCSGSTLTLTANGASTYTWSNPTTPTTGSVVTDTPTGNTTYTVTGTDANSCVNTANVSVTVNPTPTVSVVGASSQTVCSGGTVNGISFNVTPAGSVTWANSNTSLGGPDLSNASGSGNIGSYTAPNVGSVTMGVVTANATASGSGCASTSSTQATFTLMINPLPVVGGNTVTPAPCGQSSGCIDSVAVSGGAPAYQYSWDNGTTWSAASQHCNVPSGPYPLQVQDQNGCIGTATITVTSVNGPTSPSVTASNTVACVGDNVSCNINGPQGTYTYTWNDATGTATGTTYTVNNIGPAGAYTITVSATDPNGCVGTLTTLTITVNPAPTAPVLSGSVSNPLTECQGQTPTSVTVATTGTVTSIPVWYNGSNFVTTGTSYTPSTTTAGTTVYTIIDSATVTGCVNASAANVLTLTVTVNPAPGPPILGGSATNPLVECQNTTPGAVVVATTGTVTSQPVWYSGSTYVTTGTSYTPSTSTPGTTVYTISDSSTVTGCLSPASGNLTVTVTILPTPTAPVLTGTVSNPLVECENSSPGAVTVATSGTVTSVPVWYNGATYVTSGTSYSPPTTPPGTTVYTVIDSATVGGCKDASAGNVLTVTVTINPAPGTPILGGSATNPLTECQNTTPAAVVVATTGTVTSMPVWYNGSTYVTTGTSYTPSTSTPGTTIYTIADSSTATGCLSSTGSSALTVTVTILGTPTGPVLTGTVNNPFVECENGVPNPVTVATTGTVSSVPVWYNAGNYVASGTSYTPPTTPPGTTVYTVIDSATVGGCKDISAGNVLTVTVTVKPSPTLTGSATVTGSCAQPTGSIGAVTPAGGTPPYHYQWFNGSTLLVGDTLPSLSNVGSGAYSVLVTDSNGCPAISGVTSYVIPSLAVVANYTPSAIMGTAPLSVVFTNGSSGATTYLWSFGSNVANPSYTFTNAGTYTVTLVASNGPCSDSVTKFIIVDVPTTIVVPNVFTPNGDGVNDEFVINCTGMKSLTCNIFNRWGQKVYAITGPNQTWDGTLANGATAAEGTYFYMLDALGVDGKPYTFQGYITLVK